MTPAERIRAARERLNAAPRDPAAQREMAAAIKAYRDDYDDLRDVCARINVRRGGDA